VQRNTCTTGWHMTGNIDTRKQTTAAAATALKRVVLYVSSPSHPSNIISIGLYWLTVSTISAALFLWV